MYESKKINMENERHVNATCKVDHVQSIHTISFKYFPPLFFYLPGNLSVMLTQLYLLFLVCVPIFSPKNKRSF